MANYFQGDRTFAQKLIDYAREHFGFKLHTQPGNTHTPAVLDQLQKQDRLRFLQLQKMFERVGIEEPPPLLLDQASALWMELEIFESACQLLMHAAQDPEAKEHGGFHMPPYGWVRTT
jgi:hypothetical protein